MLAIEKVTIYPGATLEIDKGLLSLVNKGYPLFYLRGSTKSFYPTAASPVRNDHFLLLKTIQMREGIIKDILQKKILSGEDIWIISGIEQERRYTHKSYTLEKSVLKKIYCFLIPKISILPGIMVTTTKMNLRKSSLN